MKKLKGRSILKIGIAFILGVGVGYSIKVRKKKSYIPLKEKKEEKEVRKVENKIEDKYPDESIADIDLDQKEETVYRTKSGTRYHKENCPNLRSKIPVKISEAKEDGLSQCLICHNT